MDAVDWIGFTSAVVSLLGLVLCRGHLPDAQLECMRHTADAVEERLRGACEEGWTTAGAVLDFRESFTRYVGHVVNG